MNRLLREAIDSIVPEDLSLRPIYRGTTRGGSPATYHSETIVDFFVENQLVDVIECPIFRNGKAIATEEEFAAWMRATVEDVVERRRSK